MNRGTKGGLALVVLGLLLAGVAWKRVGLLSTARAQTTEGRPECPHDTITWTDTSGVKHEYDKIPLSGEISGIPEFHDCQRFIRRDGTYDSLYAIYAAFHLDSLPCGLNRCGVGQTGAVAAPAATILSYGGTYASLGIGNGFNCLYLWGPPDWKAVMIPQYDNPDCRYRRSVDPLPTTVIPLSVRAIQPASVPPFRDREYPPVARWDWDSLSRLQFIGIRCGLAWCEVGAPSVAPTGSPPLPTPLPFDPVTGLNAATATTKAVTMVKGWFDAQRLAEAIPAATTGGMRVRPSGVYGYIVPNPVLGDLQQSHFDATWVHVAWAIVDANYHSTVQFVRGRNKISLCYGTATRCRVPPDKVGCSEETTNIMWWAKIQAPGGPEAYRCVVWRGYPTGIDVPGTVRWRWQANDETNWIKCPSGCCEIR